MVNPTPEPSPPPRALAFGEALEALSRAAEGATAAELLALLAVARRCNRARQGWARGVAWPGGDDLARFARSSPGAIARTLRRLETLGALWSAVNHRRPVVLWEGAIVPAGRPLRFVPCLAPGAAAEFLAFARGAGMRVTGEGAAAAALAAPSSSPSIAAAPPANAQGPAPSLAPSSSPPSSGWRARLPAALAGADGFSRGVVVRCASLGNAGAIAALRDAAAAGAHPWAVRALEAIAARGRAG